MKIRDYVFQVLNHSLEVGHINSVMVTEAEDLAEDLITRYQQLENVDQVTVETYIREWRQGRRDS
jgi:hypothetical protein